MESPSTYQMQERCESEDRDYNEEDSLLERDDDSIRERTEPEDGDHPEPFRKKSGVLRPVLECVYYGSELFEETYRDEIKWVSKEAKKARKELANGEWEVNKACACLETDLNDVDDTSIKQIVSVDGMIFNAVSREEYHEYLEEQAFLLDCLKKTVVLKKRGKRFSEEQIGNKLEIVDQYPVPKDFPTRNQNRAMAGMVKVRMEYFPEGHSTIKEEFHKDGSSTVISILVADLEGYRKSQEETWI